MMDSMTRFSQAQREIGLASGEPPVTRGYPPSVYAQMPKLLERAGTNEKGSITGLYTVLVDGDDFNEPITDTARGILDGHIVLDRKLGHKNHYPAIDIMASISRCMSAIASKEHKQAAGRLKNVLATYNDAEDLINIGAYKSGSNPEIDYAITKINQVNAYLMQDVDSKFLLEDELQQLYEESMAKFIYRMQNILNIKYKLEESAKQEYAEARQALAAEEQKLDALKKRKQGYYEAYQASIQGRLDFLEIEENANSMDILDMMIEEQNAVIRQKSKELELARQKMAREMQERKMHEKLKEKKFDEFKQELNATEKRETDEVAGYQFTSAKKEVEDNGKK